jgi:hypothetical protein
VSAKKAAAGIVELARERIDDIVPLGSTPEARKLLVRAYLQGAIDGSQVEAVRARKRGPYKPRAKKS